MILFLRMLFASSADREREQFLRAGVSQLYYLILKLFDIAAVHQKAFVNPHKKVFRKVALLFTDFAIHFKNLAVFVVDDQLAFIRFDVDNILHLHFNHFSVLRNLKDIMRGTILRHAASKFFLKKLCIQRLQQKLKGVQMQRRSNIFCVARNKD